MVGRAERREGGEQRPVTPVFTAFTGIFTAGTAQLGALFFHTMAADCAVDAENWWRPFSFPRHATLLRNRSCADPLAGAEIVRVPVTHRVSKRAPASDRDRNSSDAHWYHLARGCSDMHLELRRATTLVARHRVDGAVRLMHRVHGLNASAAVAAVAKAFGGVRPTAQIGCGLTLLAYITLMARFDACNVAAPSAEERCAWDLRYNPDLLGRVTARLLAQTDWTTIVYLHEAGGRGRSTPSPAAPDAPLLWKAEVFRRASFAEDRFYDAHGAACSPSLHARRCAYCASSPLLRRACGGDEPEALVRTFSTDNLPKTVLRSIRTVPCRRADRR